jgi:Tfp pilus assembly protein PilE
MSRCVITFGYKSYVVDTEQAVAVADMLCKAERFEEKYVSSMSANTFHIWEQNEIDKFSITILPDSVYRIGKLAGKPEEKKRD